MADELKKVPARFYRSASGAEPVRDWLHGLSKEDRKEIGTDIATVEYGWPVGMPTCAPMGAGLHEVRTDLDGNRIARVLFCFSGGAMVLLHGFIKKTRKTPRADLDLARQRQREVEREERTDW
jgi:phage-related protein